jgi:hypothetical protein
MAPFVYALCALTSVGCAILLFRHYGVTRGRLLLWSAGCFFCYALTNILLFVDLVLVPNIDLSLIRNGITLVGVVMLLTALIWETN